MMDRNALKSYAKRMSPPDGDRFTWGFKRARLVEDMTQKDPLSFLTWPTVRESFYCGHTSRTEREWDEIAGTQYAHHVYDTGFGGADQRPHFIYQLYLLNHLDKCGVDLKSVNSICEFGSGFGAMPFLFGRMGFEGEYFVRDFPEVNLLRLFYLSNVKCKLETLPATQESVDLFVALSSISEVKCDNRLQFIPRSKIYLFSFSKTWDKEDNMEWFWKLVDSRPSHRWIMFGTTHPHKMCLVGVAK